MKLLMENRNQPTEVMQPLVSIIIVTLNAGKYLRECLDSVINQSYKHFEIIIKDGQSTDDTLNIVADYKEYVSNFSSSKDRGIYDAMNQAVKQATGKWIYFLGSDDKLLTGFSQVCEQLIQEKTLYYGNCITENGTFGGKYSAYKLAKYSVCQQAILYPARVFQKYQYSLQYPVFADYALNLQCWGDREFKKEYIDVDICWYNLTGFSATSKDELFKHDKPQIIKQSMGWLMYIRFLYKRRKEQRRPGSNFY